MKQFAKSLLATAALSGMLFTSAAMAEQKIGVVSVEQVFSQMPQAAGIQQMIQDEFKDRVEEVNRLQKDIEYQLNKRQREAATMNEQQIKDLEAKIMEMRKEYAEKAQPLQQDIQKRSNEERNKLLVLIRQSIDAIASEEKFDMVLQGQAAIYAKPEFDLSTKVLERVSKVK
ncbi:OmpH family outer membrane protein [Aestuariibacter sp. AA17]|uniref:OmpH family outer membrane protein n=1 Tax=Fluctibacter corallii TaxID=2984329 RepID=A0ABT3A8Q2_9ALTE|nr:OmpH family outer membrane protein [Aestuariibacter sp. AA17]MCV2884998.1 OmpH family outer membrane protein [Aestuariibacter sp. AA17]